MTASLVSNPWPASASLSPSPWRFGREVRINGPQGLRSLVQWVVKRNCSITPRQLGAVYVGLCVVSLSIALFFAAFGALYVLAFAGLELLLLGVAFVIHARHASDREVLTLANGVLAVEHHLGGRIGNAEFRADRLVIEPAGGQGSLVELSGQGQRVLVGRFLRPEHRAAFAQELRQALRRVGPPAFEIFPENELKPR